MDALFNKDSLSDNLTGVAMPWSILIALSEAFWNASDILVGWIPEGIRRKKLPFYNFIILYSVLSPYI